MVSLKFVQIFGVFGLYVKLIKGDCTSCPPVALTCDSNLEANSAVSGIFTQTFGTDEFGCKTVILNCTDDTGSASAAYMEDLGNTTHIPSGTTLTCLSNGAWTSSGSDVTLYCNVPTPATVTNPTCETSTTAFPKSITSTATTPNTSCTPGGIWSQWSNATCSDICGLCGSMFRTRTCLSETDGCPCDESSKDIGESCGEKPCSFPRSTCCPSAIRTIVGKNLKCVPV